MEHMQQQCYRNFYRITDIEYTDDGACLVGVETQSADMVYQFNLSKFCYCSEWLSHFRQPDLETVWQLTRRQQDINIGKKAINWILVKYQATMQALANWEEEAKVYLGVNMNEFDEW